MANVTPGYTFTGPTDPITYAKLNALSQPTVTIGTNEIITAMIADGSVTYAKMQNVTGGGVLGRKSATSGVMDLLLLNDGNISWPSYGIALSNSTSTEYSLGRSGVARLKMSYGEPTAKATIFVGTTGNGDIQYGSGDTDWTGGTLSYYVGNGSSSATRVLTVASSGVTGLGIFASSPSLGIGYSSGAGGTQTQTGSRTASVTLNKVCGAITTDTTSLAALASATFTVLNSTVAITDTVVASIRSGAVNEKTIVSVNHVTGTSFSITVYNGDTVVAETGAIVINFAVIKAVVS